ncbi:hypothetical protein MAR_011713 [Mya arenaria]|uniref:Endonuclease/exonuclease/phosphatase domain-containing protein n=1 Tax=Mya arenaria TaxID=6604 RepID=A0ABY7FXJ2_MYAAR|nr:hypothetical protein MAR_011713 [Mya arenaria]
MYFEQATLFDVDYGKQLGIGTDSTAIFKGCARRDMPLDLKPEHVELTIRVTVSEVLQIVQTDADVIALQEVRSKNGSSRNQLLELKALLPAQYRWHFFRAANIVSFPKEMIDTFFDGEDGRGKVYNVVALHFSYYRQQQCSNIAEVVSYVKKKQMENVVLIGDFNTYNDYEWPINLVTSDRWSSKNPCYRYANKPDILIHHGKTSYKDAWIAVHPHADGLTFSNMPSPGLESRPDRILVNSNLQVTAVNVIGNGSDYKQKYNSSIYWHRLLTVVQSSWLSYKGVKGYPCKHDCGPQGSCKCGICVAIGNKNGCNLPDCKQCDSEVFVGLLLHLIPFMICLVHLIYSVIVILTIGAGSYGETVHSIFGLKCCLFNADLFKSPSFRRKGRCLRICQKWPLFKLPPYCQLLVSLVFIVAFTYYFTHKFLFLFEMAQTVLPEESFPSDHLMLYAEIS